MSWDDFGVYAFKAMTTFGTEDDFKSFLPRILELSVTSPGAAHYDLEIVLGKLTYADWTRWPDEERAAVSGFLEATASSLADASAEARWDEWDRDQLKRALDKFP